MLSRDVAEAAVIAAERPARPAALAGRVAALREAVAAQVDVRTATVIVLGAIIIVSYQSFGSLTFFRDNLASRFEGMPRWQMYDYLYWFGSSVAWLFVLPVLVVALMPGLRLSSFGLGLGDWRFGARAAVILYAVMFPVLALASLQPNFVDYYPMSDWVRAEVQLYASDGGGAHLTSFVLYELAYASYFIGWEFFHRGFLTVGLQPALGWYAVLVVAIPFGIMHVGKPMPEAYGAIVASLLLGWLAIRTRSSWYGFALHASIAVTMDALAVLRQVG